MSGSDIMSATTSDASGLGRARHKVSRDSSSQRRQRSDLLVKALCTIATVIGLLFLASILLTLFYRGFAGSRSTSSPSRRKAPGSNGGLLNAIVGSIIQTAIGAAIGTPIGLMVGTYLAEYGQGSSLANAVRFVSDVLLSAPSILIGLFVYAVLVVAAGGFSAWAGGIALAVIVVPIVVRTTEDMLRLVPVALREAAVALGAPKWKSIVLICYRAALDGIATGVLLAIARIAGETAPLLFTSFGNLNWSREPEPVDGEPARHDLPVCEVTVRRSDPACLDRRAADHPRRARDQHHRPRRAAAATMSAQSKHGDAHDEHHRHPDRTAADGGDASAVGRRPARAKISIRQLDFYLRDQQGAEGDQSRLSGPSGHRNDRAVRLRQIDAAARAEPDV